MFAHVILILVCVCHACAFKLSRGGGGQCQSDLDCELNGLCKANSCACDPAWKGSHCAELNLLPSPVHSGLRIEDTATWGGNVLERQNERYARTLGYPLLSLGHSGNGIGGDRKRQQISMFILTSTNHFLFLKNKLK